jgi:hypothetical protein
VRFRAISGPQIKSGLRYNNLPCTVFFCGVAVKPNHDPLNLYENALQKCPFLFQLLLPDLEIDRIQNNSFGKLGFQTRYKNQYRCNTLHRYLLLEILLLLVENPFDKSA